MPSLEMLSSPEALPGIVAMLVLGPGLVVMYYVLPWCWRRRRRATESDSFRMQCQRAEAAYWSEQKIFESRLVDELVRAGHMEQPGGGVLELADDDDGPNNAKNRCSLLTRTF